MAYTWRNAAAVSQHQMHAHTMPASGDVIEFRSKGFLYA